MSTQQIMTCREASSAVLDPSMACRSASGLHYFDMMVGGGIVLAMIALIYYRYRSTALRHLMRSRQAFAYDVSVAVGHSLDTYVSLLDCVDQDFQNDRSPSRLESQLLPATRRQQLGSCCQMCKADVMQPQFCMWTIMQWGLRVETPLSTATVVHVAEKLLPCSTEAAEALPCLTVGSEGSRSQATQGGPGQGGCTCMQRV